MNINGTKRQIRYIIKAASCQSYKFSGFFSKEIGYGRINGIVSQPLI